MPPASRAAHPGNARARRRSKAHAGGHGEGGDERWLVTYADMLTLLLVLFIVLFSVSVVNTSKYISLKTSLASVFGSGTPGAIVTGGSGLLDDTSSQSGTQMIMPGAPMSAISGAAKGSDSDLARTKAASEASRQLDEFRSIENRVHKSLIHAGQAGAVRFSISRRGLVITVITNALVFPGNSADLLSGGQRILATIAPPLAGDDRKIEVDGYTNQQKVSTAPYPSGWELSSARASAVVRYLAAHHVAESRLTAVGYSDQHPLYPASDPRSVTLNRRVEIVVSARGSGSTAADS